MVSALPDFKVAVPPCGSNNEDLSKYINYHSRLGRLFRFKNIQGHNNTDYLFPHIQSRPSPCKNTQMTSFLIYYGNNHFLDE